MSYKFTFSNARTWAVLLCLLLAAGSIVLAFFGSARAGELMRSDTALICGGMLALLSVVIGVRALLRGLVGSGCLHIGLALVLGGAAWGTHFATVGMLPLRNGECSNVLVDSTGEKIVGTLPFFVYLDKFEVNFYPETEADRAARKGTPIKEYVSFVRLREDAQKIVLPEQTAEIRVNQPLRHKGWWVYQMSWGEYKTPAGESRLYTVLQCSKDRGWPVVFAGFIVCLLGLAIFSARIVLRGFREQSS